VEVLVVLDVIPETEGQVRGFAHGWPAGYFEEYFGATRDEGLVRHPQGVIEDSAARTCCA